MITLKLPAEKPRNPIARDLRSPKYKMRVVANKKKFDRNVLKRELVDAE
jgi:hypothetical protein